MFELNLLTKIIDNPYKLLYAFVSRVPFIAKRISDDKYLRIQYRSVFGKPLNLESPHTFNEKIQWLKIHDRKPEYSTMVDKYEVKKYVADRIGAEYVIPTLGVWDKFEDIDFNSLPNQFVLKCTHDSGGLVICRNKAEFDIEEAKCKISRSLGHNFYWMGREWPYKNVKPRIIAEQYMKDENSASGLTDYKFFCFNNEVKMLYVSQGLEDHATARISFYDLNGHKMPFHRKDYKPIEGNFKLPYNFQEMLDISQKLANEVGAPFVRIDLYSIAGKTKFSEITFSPCAGMIPFEPAEWNEITGNWIRLPEESERRQPDRYTGNDL